MDNTKKSFESLYEYDKDSNGKFIIVNESLFEASDDDKAVGNIIDKGLSFIPRAMRFKKAKNTMKKTLNKYIAKSKNVISEFAKSSKSKIENIDKEYKKLVKTKIEPLIASEKSEDAVVILEKFTKELEEYKSTQIQILDKSVESILAAYTTAIDKRIDSPGFVFNVELSEKGKGEIKANWQELTSTANMKIDEHKTAMILKNESYKKLDSIIAEVTSFINSNKGVTGDVNFETYEIVQKGENKYRISSRLLMRGQRLPVSGKGIIITNNPNSPETSGKNYKYNGRNALTASPYHMDITASMEDYIIPWMKFSTVKKTLYGDVVQIGDMVSTHKDSSKVTTNVPNKEDKGLEGEEKINKNED